MRSVQRPLALHIPGGAESAYPIRITRMKSFVALSDELNTLEDDYARMQLVVQRLLTILEARAILLWDVDSEMVYAKHRQHSNRLQDFERSLRDRNAEHIFPSPPKRASARVENGLMICPLVWRQRTVGAIALDREGRVPTPQEELGLLTIANQLAAILGLRTQSSRTPGAVSYQGQMDDAAEVQRSLLPSIPPSHISGLAIATHTQPAEFVGGDYFDLILLEKNKMGIVIADVQGKGVPAALFGNLLRSTVHFLTRETPSTAAVMGKVNAILHGEIHSPRKLFSMFYAVYDSENKLLTYTGSGHVSPIVVRAADGRAEYLLSDGMLIGVQAAQRFTERALALEQGDIVAFFTDGLTECRDSAGRPLGEEGLVNVLQKHKDEPVEEIVRCTVNEVSAFSQLPFADDLTLVVTKVL